MRAITVAVAAAAVLVTAGCTPAKKPDAGAQSLAVKAKAAAPKPVGDGLLWIKTASGVVVVDPTTGAPRVSLPGAVAAPDASALVVTRPEGGGTRVVSIDPSTGNERASTTLEGAWHVDAISPWAIAVALSRGAPSATELAIVSLGGSRTPPRTFPLAGNFAADAFATDGSSLFVLEYLPALHPDHYRVRQLVVATGELRDVFTREKAVPEEMSGTNGPQAYAAGTHTLYTLYTGAKEAGHAFVHTLSVDGGFAWVHCIDLPVGLGFGKPGGASRGSIALAPGGKTLYVLGPSGRVAIIDTDSLAVRSTIAVAGLSGSDVPRAVAAGTDHIWVGYGQRVVRIDTISTGPRTAADLPGAVTALTETTDGSRLVATTAGHLVVVDAKTGQIRSDVATTAVDLAAAQALQVR